MQKAMVATPTKRSITRTALLSLVLTLVQGAGGVLAQDNSRRPSGLSRLGASSDGRTPGQSWSRHISVAIARTKLPAKVLKQGVYEEIDLSLLHVDQSKLPPTLQTVQLCSAPP